MTETQHLTAEFEELVYQAQMAEDSEKCDFYTRAIEKQKLKRMGKENRADWFKSKVHLFEPFFAFKYNKVLYFKSECGIIHHIETR